MLKNKVTFERILDGRVCQCIFDQDLPCNIGKEFANQFISFIVDIENAVAKSAEEKKSSEEEKPKEE